VARYKSCLWTEPEYLCLRPLHTFMRNHRQTGVPFFHDQRCLACLICLANLAGVQKTSVYSNFVWCEFCMVRLPWTWLQAGNVETSRRLLHAYKCSGDKVDSIKFAAKNEWWKKTLIEGIFNLFTYGDQTAANKQALIYYFITAIDTRHLRV
jgi:hypothetical protein